MHPSQLRPLRWRASRADIFPGLIGCFPALPSPGCMKILIADDDRAITQVLALQLRAKGCEILLAYDAMQALMVGVRAQPDAIILDIHMPGGTGVEALR
jgi:response regulator RpfG family c-di-GMP phosphodiesterase